MNLYAIHFGGAVAAHYLAPSASRAVGLFATDERVVAAVFVEAMEIPREEAGVELLAAADAREWFEGRLETAEARAS